jgi:2-amino-4-hydroxy-6-hydroxymethyldihydropteridine diphosphokinase
MTRVFVGLGSNLAHPRRQIARALRALERIPGTRLVAHSRNYLTAPIGSSEPQPDYVNAVAALDTTLAPRALLRHLQAIERRQGRRREPARRNAPRTLDLDLLLFGGRRMRTRDLVVPHPRMHERAFVLRPLAELAAAAAIPGRGNVRRLLRGVAGQRVARTRSQRR